MSTLTDQSTVDQRTRGGGVLAVLTTLLAMTVLVVGSAMPAMAQTAVVEGVDGNAWEPQEMEIAAGTEVTFDMVGGDGAHNVVVAGEEVIPPVPIGESATYTFEEAGEFDVVCTIHPGMEMAMTVTGDGGNGDDGSGEDGEGEGSEDGDEGTEGSEDAGEDTPEDEDAEDESAEDPSEGSDAAEGGDEQAAAAEGEPEEGGSDTVLFLAIVVAVVLMIASFGLIRRHDS